MRERVVDDAAVARAQRACGRGRGQGRDRGGAGQGRGRPGARRGRRGAGRGQAAVVPARAGGGDHRHAARRAPRAEDRPPVGGPSGCGRSSASSTPCAPRRGRHGRRPRPPTRSRARAAEPSSPDAAAVRAAEAEAAASRHAARTAEARAAAAERELRETVAAINGEARRLTTDELATLRADGPSGPAVLAGALEVAGPGAGARRVPDGAAGGARRGGLRGDHLAGADLSDPLPPGGRGAARRPHAGAAARRWSARLGGPLSAAAPRGITGRERFARRRDRARSGP